MVQRSSGPRIWILGNDIVVVVELACPDQACHMLMQILFSRIISILFRSEWLLESFVAEDSILSLFLFAQDQEIGAEVFMLRLSKSYRFK